MTGAKAIFDVFGQPDGRPVIYFHGTPGAAAEAELISGAARDAGVALWAVHRHRIGPGLAGDPYLSALTASIAALCRSGSVPILGFSIGAALALRVAARLGDAIGPLSLISPAGPLDRPGVFDGMGGGAAVFRAAQANGRQFAATVAVQSLLARLSPDLVRRLLFAGADPKDRGFSAEPGARAVLRSVFASAWADGGQAYRRDIGLYVEPWSDELPRVTTPVRIWHGTADRWAPVAMGRDLASRIPQADLTETGGGHYTTLVQAAGAALAP